MRYNNNNKKVTKQGTVDHLKINNSKVFYKAYSSKVPLSKEKVIEIVTNLKNNYQSTQMQFIVTVATDIGYRSGKAFSINENVILPSLLDSDMPEDWSETKYFTVYAYNSKPETN